MSPLRRYVTEFLSAICSALFGTIRVRFVEELPDSPGARTLYVVVSPTPWAASLHCPCSCGAVIHLSLLRDDSPTWHITLSLLGVPTLSPSVWRTAQYCNGPRFFPSYPAAFLKLSPD
jgi:hypothetical protein